MFECLSRRMCFFLLKACIEVEFIYCFWILIVSVRRINALFALYYNSKDICLYTLYNKHRNVKMHSYQHTVLF